MSTSVVAYVHPAIEAVSTMAHALDEFGEASLWSMSNADLAQLVVSLERLSRRISAAQVQALAQADVSNVAAQTGAPSTMHWLRDVADVPIGVGKARLALHHNLIDQPITSGAFSAGDIGLDGATMIVAAMHALPGEVPATLNAQIEQLLVDIARDDGLKSVARRAAEITHRFAPEVLEGDEERQRQRRFLTLTQRHDGALGVRGLLDKEAGALVLAVLGPLAAPAPAVDGTPDLRDGGQRYADAFMQLCQGHSGVANGAGRATQRLAHPELGGVAEHGRSNARAPRYGHPNLHRSDAPHSLRRRRHSGRPRLRRATARCRAVNPCRPDRPAPRTHCARRRLRIPRL